MKKSIFRAVAAVLTGAMLSASCLPVYAGSDDGDYEHLVMVTRTFNAPSQDAIAKVEDALSEITKEKIGATVELIIFSYGDNNQQTQLMLTGDEQVDVIGIHQSQRTSAIAGEQILPLDDLLEEYGQGILEECGDLMVQGKAADGTTYFTPLITEMGIGYGFYIINKNLADKYDIDVEAIKSFEDLEAAFAIIHENEPNVNIVAPRMDGTISMVQNHYTYDPLGDLFGVIDNYGQSLDVVNLFETDSYREYCERVRDWYLKGYISPDAAAGILDGQELMQSNMVFCYAYNNKPGALEQEIMNCGCEVYGVQLLPTMAYTSVIYQWAIGANSVNPGKAMQLLNLMYTDSDFLNTLVYGIEGEDYVMLDDGSGRIGYPEGVDANNVEYSLGGTLWQFGNEFNAYIWESNDADIWDRTKEWNENGNPDLPYYISKAYGFNFDGSTVQNEVAAVSNVYNEYAMSLEYGAVDVDSTLEEMNRKMYAAGLQEIIDEKQRQLDIWAEGNGVE